MWTDTRFRLLPAMALLLALGGCTANVEDEGEAPEVTVEGGELPDVDVNPAEVNITTDTQTVVTPDVDVREPGS